MHGPVYNLISADLRLPPSSTLETIFAPSSSADSTGVLLSPSLPTLLLFECVLVYMAPSSSAAIIQWFVDYFSGENAPSSILGGIVYEMFGLRDPFGRVMLNNLKVSFTLLNLSFVH